MGALAAGLDVTGGTVVVTHREMDVPVEAGQAGADRQWCGRVHVDDRAVGQFPEAVQAVHPGDDAGLVLARDRVVGDGAGELRLTIAYRP